MNVPATPSWFDWTIRVLSFTSAVLGILGTGLMARRYVPQIPRSMLYAAAWPLLCLLGQGQRSRAFFKARASVNWDLPESAADMALGLNLLIWAFFLQLVALVAESL